jgi:L-alanine-DL-glutamate epimerase-like enolase superfamily enzyme
MRITKVEIIPFDQEYKGNLIFSSFETKAVGEFLLIKIYDDEGHVGLGSSVGFTKTPNLNAGSNRVIGMAILKEISTLLIGEDPRRTNYLIDKIIAATGGWGYENWFVISYIDCALWDLKGKITNVPLYDLLGGKERDKMPLEHIQSYQPTAEAQAEEALRYIEAGFKSVKMHVEGNPKMALHRMRVMRKALGDDVPISADMACGYSINNAAATINAMNEYNLNFAEQALHSYDIAGMITLRQKTTVPLVADTAGRSLPEAFECIRSSAVDAYHLLICRIGGITQAQRYADLMDAAYLDFQICNLGNSIANAAGAHFAASRKKKDIFYDELGLYLYLHNTTDTASIKDDIIIAPSGEIKDGYLHAPESGPGLGVELNEDYFKKCLCANIHPIVIE